MEARAPPSKVLFIRDIPAGMTNDEFDLLFSNLPGFVSIRRKPNFAFVEFKDRGFATSAMRRYSGYRHHPTDRPLSIDFDRDPRSRDDYPPQVLDTQPPPSHYTDEGRGGDRYESNRDSYTEDEDRSEKHRKYSDPSSSAITKTDPSSVDEKKRSRSDYDRFEKDRSKYRDSYFERDEYPSRGREFDSPPIPGYEHMMFPTARVPPPPGQFKDPQSTLFVSNLPKDVTERELSILFRFMRGFISCRLVIREGKYPICFCDFRDIPSAIMAMEILQGYRMDPNDVSSSISIEFDRSRNNPPKFK
ncbi:RNA-binding region RNP-1 domain-containing protein [Cavenderia fasciculata]|uniref:RNA-binding region RNP-1 domain-containing protein n=1 Tax=Cavenderia fasciculata TaxID=261658 RepID=F4PLK3_CACFS|nr:RNA-binding region RNP-1 domain-containing protein [Cavenderia fasciculata]EGG23425.1 RNA-binding region RNP-1 domain-containing protein [Cavenderia fasciculata]|eukprot:XP_004361276.1 RNA-binding region RNP-1 domain-containing protein [Cavenderia fasciculata]